MTRAHQGTCTAALFVAGVFALCAYGLAAEPPKQTYTPIPKEQLDKWAANLYDGARPKAYTGKCLSHVALPLGGIGTGSFAINGEGRLMQWQIFNNFNIGTMINDSFFAVWAKPEGGAPVARALQTAKLTDVPSIEGLSFVGEYPFGWFTYRDASLPVQVSLEAFNPMIPLNPKDSAYPAAIFTFTVKNPTDRPCDVALLASLQNAVGFSGQGGISGVQCFGFMKNRNLLKPSDGLTALHLGAEPGEPAAFAKPVRLFTNLMGSQDIFCTNLALGGPSPRWDLPRGGDLAKNFDVIWVERLDANFKNQQIQQIADAVEQGAVLLATGSRESLAFRFATAPRSDQPAPPPSKDKRPPVLFEDFESGTYDKWTLTGTAFGKTPATGTLAAQQPVSGFRGKFLVNTFLGGDDPKGTATSKPFTIERRYINFLIGGGHAGQTCMNLLVDGKVVRTATGKDLERLEPACWDVAPLLGKQAQLQIVDDASGGWGHINVDEILFSDEPNAIPPEPVTPRIADLLPFTCDRLGRDANPFLLKAPQERLALDPAWALIPDPGVQVGARLVFEGFKAKPDARVLLSAPDGAPLLIEGKLGKGRILVFLAEAPRGGGWGRFASFVGRLVAYAGGTTHRPATGLSPAQRTWGTMALATTAPNATAHPQWRQLAKLWADFAADGTLTNDQTSTPSEEGTTWNSALAAPLRVEPGKSASATFLVAWHFPNHFYAGGPSVRIGNMYNNWFKDAEDVVRQLATNLDRLRAETRAYHDAVYDTTLPYYVVDALTSQSDIIRSQTCMWLEDGHFLAFEGGGACCPLNCTHVWNYAQTLSKLYPTLERNFRETDLGPAMNAQGLVGHRMAVPPTGPSAGEATDGQCGTILKAYREHLQSADDAWLKKWWPRIKLATQFLIQKDKQSQSDVRVDDWTPVKNTALLQQILSAREPDGIILSDQPNTYDCSVHGPNPFIGSLYLGALRAAEEMATLCGDDAFAKQCRTIFERGQKNFDELMWNPDFGYYVQTYDEKKIKGMQFGWGCHADQTMGQWYADIVGLGYILPKDHVRSAVGRIFEHNWRTNFFGHKQVPRVYALDDDKGLLICTWPHGRRPDPVTLYSDEIWTGIEYEVAAELIYQGLVKEGLTVVLGCRDRYNGVTRPGTCCGVGNPFDETECGNTYARALSSWSVLLALQGYTYDGPKGILGFKPRYQPERHRSFFTTAEGWGVFDQRREARKQTITLDLRYGQLALKELVFELPEGAANPKAAVTVAGKPSEAALRQEGTEVRLVLPQRVVIRKGDGVQLGVSW